MNSGGLRPAVNLLRARDDKTKEMAVTLVSFVTTNHDSVREALLNAGVLPPLSNIINGDGTTRMQELAINALVNLSLSDAAGKLPPSALTYHCRIGYPPPRCGTPCSWIACLLCYQVATTICNASVQFTHKCRYSC
jgi:hypothetical protein